MWGQFREGQKEREWGGSWYKSSRWFDSRELKRNSALRKLRTRTHDVWYNGAPVRGSRCSFYDGNRIYTYSFLNTKQPAAAYDVALQTCKYFGAANHHPLLCKVCKYSALLSRGISMQTCGYLYIVPASTSETYLNAERNKYWSPWRYMLLEFLRHDLYLWEDNIHLLMKRESTPFALSVKLTDI